MIPLHKRKVEKINALQSLLENFQACYCFPQDGKTYNWKLFLKFSLPFIFLGPFILVGLAGHSYITFKRALWPEPIESMSCLLQMIALFFITFFWLSNWRNYLINLDRMNTFQFGIPSECIVFSKTINYAAPRMICGVRILILVYYCIRAFDNTFCTKTGMIGDDGYACSMPFPLWFPIGMNSFGKVIFLWACFMIVALFYLPITYSLITIPITANYLILCRIRELKRMMIKYITRPMNREELLFCIKYYAEISDCMKAMNNDLRYTFTPNRIILPIITALHLYKLIEQKDSAALVPLIPWFLNVPFLCTLGERIEYERISLCKILYDVPWYRMDIELRKTYHIYLGCMQVPMKIMVKPNAELDFSFLTEILKRTYTFSVYFSRGK